MTVTEPQIWAALGILAASLGSMIGLTVTLLTRTVTAQIQAVGVRIEGLEATMHARFEAVNVKIDALDRDVHALGVKVFGQE